MNKNANSVDVRCLTTPIKPTSTVFSLRPLSTVVSLYSLHLIALYSQM